MQISTNRPFKRAIRALAATAAFAALLGPAPASAGYQFDLQFQNWATGKCLDSNSNGDVYTLGCQRGNGWQTWQVVNWGASERGHDVVTLRNIASGRQLESGQSAGTARTSTYGGDFVWYPHIAVGPNWGNVKFLYPAFNPLNKLWYDACLDATGGFYAARWQCNGGQYQTWRIW